MDDETMRKTIADEMVHTRLGRSVRYGENCWLWRLTCTWPWECVKNEQLVGEQKRKNGEPREKNKKERQGGKADTEQSRQGRGGGGF